MVSQKQNLSLDKSFGPVCKWSVDLSKTGVRETITSALKFSAAAPAGPVYLTIPNDVAVDRGSRGEGASTPDLTCGQSGSLDAITAALNRAEHPVGIVGVADAICPGTGAGANGLSPFHLVRELHETLPGETVLSVDVGAHKMLASQVWRAASPGTFLTSNGLSAMGYGLPSALAAALIRPGRPVAGVFGDAGFAMMVQELETARRLGLRPLLVVMCDRSLAIVKVAQAMRNIPYRGADFLPVDWARVAEGFGARGVTVTTLEEMRRTGAAWLEKPELTVVAARVDEELYAGMEY